MKDEDDEEIMSGEEDEELYLYLKLVKNKFQVLVNKLPKVLDFKQGQYLFQLVLIIQMIIQIFK